MTKQDVSWWMEKKSKKWRIGLLDLPGLKSVVAIHFRFFSCNCWLLCQYLVIQVIKLSEGITSKAMSLVVWFSTSEHLHSELRTFYGMFLMKRWWVICCINLSKKLTTGIFAIWKKLFDFMYGKIGSFYVRIIGSLIWGTFDKCTVMKSRTMLRLCKFLHICLELMEIYWRQAV